MIKALLFNIDGTLVDSNNAHAETWVKAFTKFGYNISYEVIRPLMGMGRDQLIPTLLKGLQKESNIGEKTSTYRKNYSLESMRQN